MKFNKSMLISATSLIKESWKIYKNNFLLFLKIVAWLFIPTVLWTAVDLINLTEVAAVPINICLGIVYFILGLFVSVALILVADHLEKGKDVDLKSIFTLTYSKIFFFFWVSVLANLAVILGMLLLIVPGVILAVLFSFASLAAVLDGQKGFSALSYSKKLVKENFWGILWRWVASYFVYAVFLSIVILGLIYLIGLSTGQLGALISANGSLWWSNFISDALSLLSLPLFSIIAVLLYNSLKKEKGN